MSIPHQNYLTIFVERSLNLAVVRTVDMVAWNNSNSEVRQREKMISHTPSFTLQLAAFVKLSLNFAVVWTVYDHMEQYQF